jgi:hypothetical protein
LKYLSKIPFWGWVLFLSVICYGLWNPWGFSLVGLWSNFNWAEPFSWKMPAYLLLTLSFVVILSFFVFETKRTLGTSGVVIYLVFVFIVVWLFYSLGVENLGVFKYIGPFIFALLLAIGSQFNKLRRYATGRVTVEDPDTNLDPSDDSHLDHEH